MRAMNNPVQQVRSQTLDLLHLHDRRDSGGLNTRLEKALADSWAEDGYWRDIDYETNSGNLFPAHEHLTRIRALVSSVVPASKIKIARERALLALKYWIRKDYLHSNWWFNQIGAPRLVAEILLLLGEEFAHQEDARRILDRSGSILLKNGVCTSFTWTGANQLWMCWNRLLRGAIFDEPETILRAATDAAAEVRLNSRTEDGLQVDFSFHQHGSLLFNNGYGRAFISTVHLFLKALRGTSFEFEPKKRELLIGMLLDGNRWMVRGSVITAGTADREIAREHASEAVNYAPIARSLAEAGHPRLLELEEFADTLEQGKAPGNLDGCRMFFRSDFFSRQNPKFYMTVRMCSTRTVRAESINGENMLGHHLSDGVTLFMRRGDEYKGIYPLWDWQKLPGTTALQRPVEQRPDEVKKNGGSDFTGGATDGKVGVCAQQIRWDELSALKGWFFGPDYVVCLGAGITSSMAGEVVTVLDQSWRRPGIDGASLEKSKTVVLSSPVAIKHDGWGFEILSNEAVRLSAEYRRSNWNRIGVEDRAVEGEVFQLWISHGERPENATYAYAVHASETVTERPFRILANSSSLQAVEHTSMRCLQTVFRHPGRIEWPGAGIVEVDQPCILMIHAPVDAAATIYLADASQAVKPIRLSFTGGSETFVKSIEMPAGDYSGDTVAVNVSR